MLHRFIKLTVNRLHSRWYSEVVDKYYSVDYYSIKEAVKDCINDERLLCDAYTITCDGVTLYNSITGRIAL